MSASVHELRQNLSVTREQYGRRSSRTAEAFQALVRGAADAGAPIDGLRHHTENEAERFFSWTIPSVDEHVYWDGPKYFTRNDKKSRTPLRWWWQHKYGGLLDTDDLVVKCGEKNCCNPEHAAKERRRGAKLYYTHERCIGAFQVATMRLGHTPSSAEWKHHNFKPHSDVLRERFGTWDQIVKAAGVPPVRAREYARTASDLAVQGLLFVKETLGRWPSRDAYEAMKDELRARDLPTSGITVYKALGCKTWRQGVLLAQNRTAVDSPVDSTSRESGASQRSEP